MTHLESLTKKIHALLPELLELSFGCEVSTGGFTNWIMLNTEQAVKQEVIGNSWYIGKPLKGSDHKILGHPITLNEIIEVLPEEYGYSKAKGFVKFHKEPRQHYTREAVYWAKGLPLEKQSPETIKFLDDLLPAHMSEPQNILN